MIAIGSDTGGSVRQPADYCGVVGLKPSYGRISRYGLIAYASSFDCVGVLGQSVADVAAVYDVLAGPDGLDSTAMQDQPTSAVTALGTAQKPLRFAWLQPTLGETSPDAEIQSAIRYTFAQLEAAGHTVTAVPFDLMEYIVPTYYVLTTAEASSNLGRFDGIRYGHAAKGNADDLTAFYKQNRSEGFGTEVKRRIMLGTFVLSAGYFDAYFTKAQQVRANNSAIIGRAQSRSGEHVSGRYLYSFRQSGGHSGPGFAAVQTQQWHAVWPASVVQPGRRSTFAPHWRLP
jgi:aspartyl-tRNA(Asn)/glutamyl-tRNA(Gln) amidotransferase subunit A